MGFLLGGFVAVIYALGGVTNAMERKNDELAMRYMERVEGCKYVVADREHKHTIGEAFYGMDTEYTKCKRFLKANGEE